MKEKDEHICEHHKADTSTHTHKKLVSNFLTSSKLFDVCDVFAYNFLYF